MLLDPASGEYASSDVVTVTLKSEISIDLMILKLANINKRMEVNVDGSHLELLARQDDIEGKRLECCTEPTNGCARAGRCNRFSFSHQSNVVSLKILGE